MRGRLEKLQESTSQLVVIEDKQSSRLEVEEEQAEGENKGEAEEAEQSEEENEEAAEHSKTETEAEAEQSKQEEGMGQQEGSPLQDLVGEDELAAVLANMGKYGQPSSPVDLHEKPQEENTSEKSHAVEAEKGNLSVHDEEMIWDTE